MQNVHRGETPIKNSASCLPTQDRGTWNVAHRICINKVLLTQRWAGRQSLFSARCQTFQSMVVALVHQLPCPNQDSVEMRVRKALAIA